MVSSQHESVQNNSKQDRMIDSVQWVQKTPELDMKWLKTQVIVIVTSKATIIN